MLGPSVRERGTPVHLDHAVELAVGFYEALQDPPFLVLLEEEGVEGLRRQVLETHLVVGVLLVGVHLVLVFDPLEDVVAQVLLRQLLRQVVAHYLGLAHLLQEVTLDLLQSDLALLVPTQHPLLVGEVPLHRHVLVEQDRVGQVDAEVVELGGEHVTLLPEQLVHVYDEAVPF